MTNLWIGGIIIAALVGAILYLYAKEHEKKSPEKWAAGGVIATLLITLGIWFYKKRKDEKSR